MMKLRLSHLVLIVALTAKHIVDVTANKNNNKMDTFSNNIAIDVNQDYGRHRLAVLEEMKHPITSATTRRIEEQKINAAVRDFDPNKEESGKASWRFLSCLASSQYFVSHFWQKRPLLIRSREMIEITQLSNKRNWVDGSFTVENHLKLIDGSYISGSRTDDVLRKGIKTDSWAFRPIKDDPARKSTWKEVQDALEGGTIYFNSAGSFWPSLGALCRLTNYAFGLPTNVNIYITPPGSMLSVPPHTDRQDVIVFQTEGSKRWRVFYPPKRIKGKDPLNRGKSGDVLDMKDLGKPILDVVLRKGDVMYVPAGFPHTTDTATIVEQESVPVHGDDGSTLFDETSVHLTMGLDSHVWALTYAHMRWTLLQRCGKEWKLDIKNDTDYWDSMKTLPIGFLLKSESESQLNRVDIAIEEMKSILKKLEPTRWEKESLPSDEEIRQVAKFMLEEHMSSLFEIQEYMYSDIDPHDENTIVKGYECTQRQDSVMQRYGAFSNNDEMKNAFEKRRLDREKKAATASSEL